MPATSVFSTRRTPAPNNSVLAAPTAWASGETSSATSMASLFKGIVSDQPTHSGPVPRSVSGKACSSHSIRSYRQLVRPSAR